MLHNSSAYHKCQVVPGWLFVVRCVVCKFPLHPIADRLSWSGGHAGLLTKLECTSYLCLIEVNQLKNIGVRILTCMQPLAAVTVLLPMDSLKVVCVTLAFSSGQKSLARILFILSLNEV
eukprot:GHRR01013362.1.p2 GENE.GHRR01013362.1~~GHRR01013362.1.p2  ORF type:complete len:119 (+),score=11.42 GHRR01013362.1:1872-2228(+)